MTKPPVIYWLRRDLRLQDNPALRHALASDHPLMFVYIHEPEDSSDAPGAASRWWLHHSLTALQGQLDKFRQQLYCFAGSALEILPQLTRQTASRQVVCTQCYEPAALALETQLKTRLAAMGVSLDLAPGNYLFSPGTVRNQQGECYKVFTPFYKACLAQGLPTACSGAPKKIPSYVYAHPALSIAQLRLLPAIDWTAGLQDRWQPGEAGAWQQWQDFIKQGLSRYKEDRDYPAQDGTSHVSPHLHFGEIAPARLVYELSRVSHKTAAQAGQVDAVIRQLVWRDFACHILMRYPHTTTAPFQEKFKHFAWRRSDKKLLRAWQQGQTGYPLIDAGMRELWHTGYMHNRVRMLVASFLTKNALLHWHHGARWFWDTLVDADLAQNSMNWQWVAGCGVDAAPYFRIFNPVSQSQKFDAQGDYIRRWCPELGALPRKFLHAPWTASEVVLQQAGVRLGTDYPRPLLDLMATRERALAMYKALRATPR
ncbi:MAG: deoxyribodipyrimidine photo-lyase [Gammaproteobacteria bacterium]